MSDKLEKAFGLTDEEHAGAFERYANAFLVDDYPELQALGGKKDRGMDARIFNNETGKTELVVQSCVSIAVHLSVFEPGYQVLGNPSPPLFLSFVTEPTNSGCPKRP